MRATLAQFAGINDAAAATPSKLDKQSIFGTYLRGLDEQDLRLAIRFARGRPFPETDERVLNMGWAAVRDVVIDLLRFDPQVYYEQVIRSGEVGEALARIWPSFAAQIEPLTLADLQRAFEDLARSSVAENKRQTLHELLRRCTSGREVAYVVKIMFREMRTGMQEGNLQAAVAFAFEKPLRDIQKCQLLVGDLEEVAVLAKRDDLCSAQFRLFHPIQFMLATPQDTPAIAAETMAGRTFLAEDKLDGIRAQVHKSGDRIVIYTRTMDRADECFPDVIESLSRIPGEFLLDGEIVPWSGLSVLPFAHIQRRLGRKNLSPRMLRENPVAFIAFDLLYLEGDLLMDQPLRMRRAALEKLAAANLLITSSREVSTEQQIAAAFEEARARRNEGIVLKDPESAYAPGRRGQAWLKLKTHLPTLDCVVTAAEYGHGKRRGVLSDYTFAVWDRDPADPAAQLVNVGKAYSGVTDEQIAELTDLFLKLSIKQFGHIHYVEPKVVMEIACDQIQKSTRHASGYAMRFPRIKRIRRDKRPEDADRLSRVIELYESPANFAYQHADEPAPEPTLFDSL